MAEAAANLSMPSKVAMVDETIARFDTAGVRSQLLALDGATLRGLGLMLTDKAVTVLEAYLWLEKECGGTVEEPAYNKNAVYRLAEHFRRIYAQVRREHAQRLARLTVEHATEGNVAAMQQVAHNRLSELLAERLVESDSLEDLTPSELGAMISAQANYQAGQLELAKLKLKQAEDLRKATKLEDDLKTSELKRQELADDLKTAELRRQEMTQKLTGVLGKIKALAEKLKVTEKRREDGKKVDPAVYISIREQLAALAFESAGDQLKEIPPHG